MAVEVVMPRLGWTMEEGTLVEWLKHDGDPVQSGDILFVIESDKALNEVESFESGIFRIPPDANIVGKLLPVGALLAYIVQPGEAPPFEPSESATVTAQVTRDIVKPSEQTAIIPATMASEGRTSLPVISPRARRVAAELGVEWTTLMGSGRSGRIVERDVRAVTLTTSPPIQISPVAKRAAEDLGVNVAELAATMPGQRITRDHVERAAQSTPAALSEQTKSTEVRTAIPRIRQVIAERMSSSAHTTAPVTLTSEVDATGLVKLRQGLKAASQSDTRPIPSYNDLLAKLVAEVLIEHPQLNARIEGDSIVTSSAVHLGFAVDTERGLFVPVVRDVQNKSIRQITAESVALIEHVRIGTIRPDDLSGGTFTITNLGMYDIDSFTPIINLPQCAILGIGRIVPKQIVMDAETELLAVRHMMFLSLTFDHRLVDGAPAARFLQHVKRFVEQPYLWLIN